LEALADEWAGMTVPQSPQAFASRIRSALSAPSGSTEEPGTDEELQYGTEEKV
jgi:hypothetical protein